MKRYTVRGAVYGSRHVYAVRVTSTTPPMTAELFGGEVILIVDSLSEGFMAWTSINENVTYLVSTGDVVITDRSGRISTMTPELFAEAFTEVTEPTFTRDEEDLYDFDFADLSERAEWRSAGKKRSHRQRAEVDVRHFPDTQL